MLRLLVCLTLLQFSGLAELRAAEPGISLQAKRKRKRKRKWKRKRKRRKRKQRKVSDKAPPQKKAAKPPKPTVPEPPVQTKAPAQGVDEADDRPGVALLDFKKGRGIDQSMADLLSELLLTKVGRSAAFSSVMGGSDLRDLLNLEQQKTILGCEDDSCLAALGGALGVPLLIAPSIGKLGGSYILSLKITDVEAAQVKVRVNKEIHSDDQLKRGLETLVDQLLAELQGEQAEPSHETAAKPVVKTSPRDRPAWFSRVAIGLVGLGLTSAGGAYWSHQRTLANFQSSHQTIADYDQGLKATAYANLGLGLGLSAAVLGGGLWWIIP